MAVTVRLARAGAKKKPYYHVVATDSRNPRDGKFIEAIGMYDPNFNPPKFQLDETRYAHWVKVGARPSDTILTLRKAAAKAKPAKA